SARSRALADLGGEAGRDPRERDWGRSGFSLRKFSCATTFSGVAGYRFPYLQRWLVRGPNLPSPTSGGSVRNVRRGGCGRAAPPSIWVVVRLAPLRVGDLFLAGGNVSVGLTWPMGARGVPDAHRPPSR